MGIPTIFTRQDEQIKLIAAIGAISRKRIEPMRRTLESEGANDIARELEFRPGRDIILEKSSASAFFGTDLLKILIFYGIDTVIVTGATTSGCVRATVVDAAGYNFYVIVPKQCVSDRSELSHKVSLMDMQMKYADVLPVARVVDYLASLER